MGKLWGASAVIIGLAVLVVQYIAYTPDFPPPPEACDSNALSIEDYTIYRSLLEKHYSMPRITDGATIFVPETIQVSDRYLRPDIYLSAKEAWIDVQQSQGSVGLSQDAVANLLRMSADQTPLAREHFENLPIVLTSQAEIDDVFQNKGGWSALGASTILRFSRIGFNCSRDQALLYRSQSCGLLCGSGQLLILEKDGEQWQTVSTLFLWIS